MIICSIYEKVEFFRVNDFIAFWVLFISNTTTSQNEKFKRKKKTFSNTMIIFLLRKLFYGTSISKLVHEWVLLLQSLYCAQDQCNDCISFNYRRMNWHKSHAKHHPYLVIRHLPVLSIPHGVFILNGVPLAIIHIWLTCKSSATLLILHEKYL